MAIKRANKEVEVIRETYVTENFTGKVKIVYAINNKSEETESHTLVLKLETLSSEIIFAKTNTIKKNGELNEINVAILEDIFGENDLEIESLDKNCNDSLKGIYIDINTEYDKEYKKHVLKRESQKAKISKETVSDFLDRL